MAQQYKLKLNLPAIPYSLSSGELVLEDINSLYNAVHILGLYTIPQTYTFANLPLPGSLPSGVFAVVSDLGNSLWYNTGTSWILTNNYIILAQSSAISSVTGTLVKTNLISYTLPGNVLGANGCLRISGIFSMTSSANIKNIGVSFGGTDILTYNRTLTDNQNFCLMLKNRSATNAQIVQRSLELDYSGALPVSAVDTAANVTISLWGQLSNVGETISVETYTIELLKV